MSITNKIGDIGETRIIYEAIKRGYNVLMPFGHDNSYDIVIDKGNGFERIQIKTTHSDGIVIKVPGRSVSNITKGKQVRTRYTPENIEWIAIFDITTDQCFYVPSSFLGRKGKDYICLRYSALKNNSKINWAKDFREWK